MNESPVRVVMTLMVRNEHDVIAAMIEHHLAQGIDHIIITDNGSDDGTREILADYEKVAPITVYDDARRDFPQAENVSRMAREAATRHAADWVLNSDADEFWVATDPELTLLQALAHAPRALGSFVVPVFNMLGTPVMSGDVFETHVWRDLRDVPSLNDVGLHAQPTHNLAHIGSAEVEVLHGNHFSSLPVTDLAEVPDAAKLQVYHFPWRTWEEYQVRVRGTGSAHVRSGRQPSPKHHTMRDYRWDQAGILEPFFVARHPAFDQHGELVGDGFVRDERIRECLAAITPKVNLPEQFRASSADTHLLNRADEEQLRRRHREIAPVVLALEDARVDELTRLRQDIEQPRHLRDELEVTQAALLEAQERVTAAHREVESWMIQWQSLRSKRLVRAALLVERAARRLFGRRGQR